MGKFTKIQWADSTVNGQMGCDGCELWTTRPDGSRVRICYAGRQTENILRNGPRAGWPAAFDQPRIFPERIAEAARWADLKGTAREGRPWLDGLPRMIFFNDMGDTWTVSLPLDWLAPYLPAIASSPHVWMILTKRPDRAADFSRLVAPLPDNVWIGTSITGAQDARLRALMRVRAARRFVSYEPILADAGDVVRRFSWVDWWVFGGASGVEVPTEIATIRTGVAACREVGSAPFVKQFGSWPVPEGSVWEPGQPPPVMRLTDRKGGDWNEWPEDLRYREFPRPKERGA